MSGNRTKTGYGRSATAPIKCGTKSSMKRPPMFTSSAGASSTTHPSSRIVTTKIIGETVSMSHGRTRKNTPVWRPHNIISKVGLTCIATCSGKYPRQSPMSADGCSASTAIWPPDTHWPLLTNQNQASRQWMTCWPVWTMWIWQSRPSSRLRNAGRSKGKPRPKRSISRHGRTAALCVAVPASMEF